MSAKTKGLTVAVTGPTGTFGFGLMPLLQADDRVGTIVGIARRPFDPSEHGWSKMEYRRGDVRDEAVLKEAFSGADVVVHLAFLIVGGNKETTRSINVDGTLNVFRAAAYADSVPGARAGPAHAVHPRRRRRPGAAAVRCCRRASGRLQHRRRRRAQRRRRSAGARVAPGAVARRPGTSGCPRRVEDPVPA